MWLEAKVEMERSREKQPGLIQKMLLCTGDMLHLDKHVEDQWFGMQLLVWGLRGVSRVILANNPLSGALILAALFWASPWQGLLGSVGVLLSTLAAIITGQDRGEVSAGLHGSNGMLVSLLMGVFSSAGDWYCWLLLPVCLGSATCAIPPGAVEANATGLSAAQVIRGVPLGVGQIFACDALGPSLLILGAVLLYSPLLAVHAVLGSAIGTLAGPIPIFELATCLQPYPLT